MRVRKQWKADKTPTFGSFHEVAKHAPKVLFSQTIILYNLSYQPEEGGGAIDRRRTGSSTTVRDGSCSVGSAVGQDLQFPDDYLAGRRLLAAGDTSATRNPRCAGGDDDSDRFPLSLLEERGIRSRGYQDADSADSLHGCALVLCFIHFIFSDRSGDRRVHSDQRPGLVPNRSLCCTDRYQRRALSASRADTRAEPFPFFDLMIEFSGDESHWFISYCFLGLLAEEEFDERQ